METTIKQIIDRIKRYLNKKHDNPQECISDEELKQKKKKFQTRKIAIDTRIHAVKRLLFDNSSLALNLTISNILDVIDDSVSKLRRFDKYDLTNPCMTYEEYYNMIVNNSRTEIINILENAFIEIPIEVLVYYALHKSYLHRLLNEYDDLEYYYYCGMFKNDVVILLVDLGFESLFG